MATFKRITLFMIINFVIVLTLSTILQFFHIQPYLTSYGIDYNSLIIFCFIWGMGGAFISLLLSRKIAKMMMRVRVIDPHMANGDHLVLINIVKKLSYEAGLVNIPEVGIYPSQDVNAFATGPSKKRSLIAISEGLFHRMSQSELEAIIGHEISHIANGDMVTMTLLQGVANAFVMFLARVLAFALSGFNNRNRSSFFSYWIFTFIFEILFMAVGTLVLSFFSRRREFRADQGGAKLAGKEKMIQALLTLQSIQHKEPMPKEPSGFNSLKISSNKKGFHHLFASHPPLEERIAQLKRES